MFETALVKSNIILPPNQAKLPWDDAEPMEILINALQPWLAERADGYISGNMFLYFSLEQIARLTGLSEPQLRQLNQ